MAFALRVLEGHGAASGRSALAWFGCPVGRGARWTPNCYGLLHALVPGCLPVAAPVAVSRATLMRPHGDNQRGLGRRLSRDCLTPSGHGLDSRRRVSHGFGGLLSRGTAGARGAGGRLLDRPAPGDESAICPFRRGDGLRHRRRAAARSGALPGRPRGKPGGREHGLHANVRSGRPQERRELVGLDARGGLETPARTGKLSRWPGRASGGPGGAGGCRRRTAPGSERCCRQRSSGSLPRGVGSTAPSSPGGTRSGRMASSWPTPGRGISPGTTRRRTDSPTPRRSAAIPATATACSTWRATSGSGPRIGTPPREPKPGERAARPSMRDGAEREASVTPQHAQFRIPRKVVKGGSHLCAPSYCFRYRPAARQPQDIGTGMSHLGFRCVVRS